MLSIMYIDRYIFVFTNTQKIDGLSDEEKFS